MTRLSSLLLALALFVPAALPSAASADEADDHYRAALTHKRAGRLREALAEARAAIRARPTHASAHFTAGSLWRQLDNLEGALACFRESARLRPRHADSHGMVGAVLIRLRRYEEAIEPLRKAAELDPDTAHHWSNLGMVYRQLRRNDEAIEAYEAGLRRHQEDVGLLNNLAVAYRRARRNEEAIILLQQAIEHHEADANADIHFNLAVVLRASERCDDALPHYRKAIDLGRDDEGVLFDLAICYEQVGENDAAIRTYERYIEKVSGSDPAAAQRARDTIARLRRR